MWTWLLAVALGGDCPDDPARSVRDSAALMVVNFAALDGDGFDLARADLDAALPCLSAPLTGHDVVAVHRAMALAEFADGDMVAVRKSFGALRQLEPGWTIPETLVPPGHLLRDLYAEAPTSTERVDLDLAPDGGWDVDGAPSTTVPAEVAFVLQGLGKEGEILYSGYHTSVADIPVLDFARPGISPRTRRMRVVGAVGGGALVALGAGMIGLGQVTKSDLNTVPYDKVSGTRTRAEVLGVGGVGTAVLGAGLGTAAFVVRW